ncbi:MAG TPA: alpha/beta hydrolase fold domain-containing protein [Solirubrobacteraceae bacterium]|nr:alpha/beta hydrolase fold domain-containing protein [Solirubrobacteraceae bacterium]
MTTETLSIGEQVLLDHYVTSNAASRAGLTPEFVREQDQRWGDVASEPRGVDYLETEAGGVPALWLLPARRVDGKVLLCLHGGGFVGGSMYTHRRLYAHLAKRTGVRALALDYRQLPDHPHPAAAEDTEAAYRWLLSEGYEGIAVVGDSAGGGLALGLAISSELPAPATVVGLSPWTDMTLSGPSMETNQRTDALFGGDHPMDLDGMVDFVLGGPGRDRRDPRVSPLHGDLGRLPPTYLQVSVSEMLFDDARRLADAAPSAVRLDVFDNQQHTFQMAAGRSPVADDAVVRVAAWLRDRLEVAER